jgi:hypothetical protein
MLRSLDLFFERKLLLPCVIVVPFRVCSLQKSRFCDHEELVKTHKVYKTFVNHVHDRDFRKECDDVATKTDRVTFNRTTVEKSASSSSGDIPAINLYTSKLAHFSSFIIEIGKSRIQQKTDLLGKEYLIAESQEEVPRRRIFQNHVDLFSLRDTSVLACSED